MNCYYIQSLKLCTEKEGIPYSLNDDQFDIGMDSQDCAQCSSTLITAESNFLYTLDQLHFLNATIVLVDLYSFTRCVDYTLSIPYGCIGLHATGFWFATRGMAQLFREACIGIFLPKLLIESIL